MDQLPQSGLRLGAVSASENEFLAEETLVTIIPRFRHPRLEFISNVFGPFEPQTPAVVPLWLAITLRKRNKCQIVPPEWMELDNLQSQLDAERVNNTFQDLPFHWMEIVTLLLKNARDDVADVDRIKALINDLQNVRLDKIRTGITAVAAEVQGGNLVHSVQMNNIGSMEILLLRGLLLQAMKQFKNLATTQEEVMAPADTAMMNNNTNTGGMGMVIDANTATGTSVRKLRRHRG